MMKNLVSILDREVNGHEVCNVRKIYLEIGALKYVVPEILILAFEQIPKNKKLDNAKIQIEIIPVKIRCDNCGVESVVKKNLFRCTECLSTDVSIISGKEFNLKGIEW